MGCLVVIIAIILAINDHWMPAVVLCVLAWFMTPPADRKIHITLRDKEGNERNG